MEDKKWVCVDLKRDAKRAQDYVNTVADADLALLLLLRQQLLPDHLQLQDHLREPPLLLQKVVPGETLELEESRHIVIPVISV